MLYPRDLTGCVHFTQIFVLTYSGHNLRTLVYWNYCLLVCCSDPSKNLLQKVWSVKNINTTLYGYYFCWLPTHSYWQIQINSGVCSKLCHTTVVLPIIVIVFKWILTKTNKIGGWRCGGGHIRPRNVEFNMSTVNFILNKISTVNMRS